MSYLICHFERVGSIRGFHAFMGVLERKPNNEMEWLEALHYKKDQGKLVAYHTPRGPWDGFSDLEQYAYFEGEVLDNELWGRALLAAKLIHDQSNDFTRGRPNAFNCVAGLKTSVNAMGFDYVPFIKKANGLDAQLLSPDQIEEIQNEHFDDTRLEQLRAELKEPA